MHLPISHREVLSESIMKNRPNGLMQNTGVQLPDSGVFRLDWKRCLPPMKAPKLTTNTNSVLAAPLHIAVVGLPFTLCQCKYFQPDVVFRQGVDVGKHNWKCALRKSGHIANAAVVITSKSHVIRPLVRRRPYLGDSEPIIIIQPHHRHRTGRSRRRALQPLMEITYFQY